MYGLSWLNARIEKDFSNRCPKKIYLWQIMVMLLSRISLVNFKNHASFECQFSNRFTALCGSNGAGKTAVLDAVHYLCLCKSYFNSIDAYQIKYDQEFFLIKADFELQEQLFEVSCGVKRNQKKTFRVNKKEYNRLAEHIGKFPLVMISPNDMRLILDGSEERRRFIDTTISQEDGLYMEKLISYNAVLDNRNTMLKNIAETNVYDPDLLDIYDTQLSNYGTDVFRRRTQFLEEYIEIFTEYYQYLSGGKEEVGLVYMSQLQEQPLMQLLQKNKEKDRVLERTSSGIHKDDLLFLIDQQPIKRFGSQGQQKTFLTALKLSQYALIKKHKGIRPLLLLDDIFDKLDGDRVQKLIQHIAKDDYGQVFITDTDEKRISDLFSSIGVVCDCKVLE